MCTRKNSQYIGELLRMPRGKKNNESNIGEGIVTNKPAAAVGKDFCFE